MRGNIVKIMVVTVAVVLFSVQGWATPILLPSPYTPSNSGDGTIQAWLIASINFYNTTHNPDLSPASVGPHPDIKVEEGDIAPPGYSSFSDGTSSITLPGDLNDYLVLKWGGPKSATRYEAYDLTTSPEASDIFAGPDKYSLSHYQFYGDGDGPTTSIPEPSTLLLLGAGLVGFGILGRRKFRS